MSRNTATGNDFARATLRAFASTMLIAIAALGCSADSPNSPPLPMLPAGERIFYNSTHADGPMRLNCIARDGSARVTILQNNIGIISTPYRNVMALLKYVGGAHSVSEWGMYTAATNGSNIVEQPRDRFSYVMDLSPNADRIAYIDPSKNRLFVSALDGSNVVEIASAGDQAEPVFSPDGLRIAYIGRDSTGPSKLIVSRIDGTEHRTIADSAGASGFPQMSWSPDGQYIAYVSTRSATMIADVDNRTARRLRATHESDSRAIWSPDGSRIAIESSGGIWLYAADGSGEQQLAWRDGGLSNHAPQWSRDGSHLLYITQLPHDWQNLTGTHLLKVVDISSGATSTIATDAISAFWDYSD